MINAWTVLFLGSKQIMMAGPMDYGELMHLYRIRLLWHLVQCIGFNIINQFSGLFHLISIQTIYLISNPLDQQPPPAPSSQDRCWCHRQQRVKQTFMAVAENFHRANPASVLLLTQMVPTTMSSSHYLLSLTATAIYVVTVPYMCHSKCGASVAHIWWWLQLEPNDGREGANCGNIAI